MSDSADLSRERSELDVQQREIEELVAARFPRPEAPARLRRLPSPAGAAAARSPLPATASAATRASVTSLSAERCKLQVTLSRRARDLLLTAQALMRHRVPDGDMSRICEEALESHGAWTYSAYM